MSDPITLTVTTDTSSPFVLTNSTSSNFILTGSTTSPVTLQLGATLTGVVNLTGPSSFRGFEAFVSGGVNDGDVIVASLAPYTFTANPANCIATALDAPLTQIIFTINKTVAGVTTQIGTITFDANENIGVIVFTDPVINHRDLITIITPSAADATISNITFLVAE